MTNLTIRDTFDLPAEIPPCIVKIMDFDDDQTMQENIRDYVITDTVAAEMERLADRIIASCVRHGAGEGHYLHGSFGSGKSHFMAILGLILENKPAVWAKEHPAIQRLRARHSQWLANHPMLVVPIYMLGQKHSLQVACYSAANDRLQRLGHPPCEFSDAGKVIANFRADANRYGEVVYQQFQEATGISRSRFDRLATGDQEQRDELAQQLLAYREPSRSERAQLYPDKFSDGIAMLARHVQTHGFHGIIFLIDELILYLGGKKGREYINEFNDLVALADNSALDRAVPLWVIVARQRNIAELVPDDMSEQHINEAMEHHKDRFPETTTLADTELVPIVQERVLRVKAGLQTSLRQTVDDTLTGLGDDVRRTLMHDLSPDDFRRVYPFHPALIRTLIDVTARLSRERAAIRLLYELLIQRHPKLTLGSLIPYGSLFDIVFLPDGVATSSRNEELEAVRQTYYERLAPVIDEAYNEPSQAERARLVIKTALLCGLSKTMQNAITVERILHLNYQDLRGRTPFGSYQAIAQILSELDNRSELVHFTANLTNPAQASVAITLASGAQLSDVLKRVQVNWRQRLDAFAGLMRELLEKPIQNSEIPGYERIWRGSRRRGRIRFTNLAELSLNELTVAGGDEFTLFVDYPFDADVAYTRADDLQLIERAKKQLGQISVGFWLPTEFSADELHDLEDYARILEVEANPNFYLGEYGRSQRESLESKLAGQKRSKARALRERLIELYKGPGAEVTFLDSTITPSLDAQTVGGALDRIAEAVCDRRYPHHPRFPTEANQRALRRLLEDFLIPAAQRGGSVARNTDLDDLLKRLGEPLELADRGAQNWTLRLQSRYLNKLMELATGKRVQADKIREGLVEAFGFNRDLTDTFLLYLIRAQGYRAMKGDQPAASVDYGGLTGLSLERGERLEVYQWAEVKEFVKDTWLIQSAITELSIAAQDKLWNQLNAAARKAAGEMDQVRQRLVLSLTEAQADVNHAPRLAILDAAIELNTMAQREDLDAHDGLKALLGWKPQTSEADRPRAASQIATRQRTHAALIDLEVGTIKRIVTLAQGNNNEAQASQQELQRFLAAPAEEADLASYVVSWLQQANRIIDAALDTTGTGTKGEVETGPAKGQADTGEIKIGQREEKAVYQITSAHLVFGDQQHPLDAQQVSQALASLLQQIEDQAKSGQDEITIQIVLKKKTDG